MTGYDTPKYDAEKGMSPPLEGAPAVDPGLYNGEHDEANPTGTWAKFDGYNRKLERKLGIETVCC
jgi:hypothetical protein